MTRFASLLVLIFLSHALPAQKNYFIFIRHEAAKPFYIRMGEKSFSSTEGGHITLAQLHDSAYAFYIGFPRSMVPEQFFSVDLAGRDRGFELRHEGGKWVLSDWLGTDSVIGKPVEQKRLDSSLVRKMDSYSELMAAVVNDSIVLYSTVEKPDTALEETIKIPVKEKNIAEPGEGAAAGSIPAAAAQAAVQRPADRDSSRAQASGALPAVTDSSVAITNDAPRKAVIKDSADSAAPKPPSNGNIMRYSSENKLEGKEVIYLDKTAAATDTIRILIPRL